MRSFPVPVSPRRSTTAFVEATLCARLTTSRNATLSPRMPCAAAALPGGLRRALRRSVAQLPGVIPDRSLVVVVQSASSVPSVVDGSFMATLQ